MVQDTSKPEYGSDEDEGAATAYLVASGVAFQGHGKLWAISTTLTAAGGSVDVYDGIDANGRPLWSHRDPGALSQSNDFSPEKPVRIERGVYVAITTAIVTITYEPRAYLREELK